MEEGNVKEFQETVIRPGQKRTEKKPKKRVGIPN